MDYPLDDDDPVIWQCSQAVVLRRIFADEPVEPVPAAPPPSRLATGPSTRTGTGTGPHGVKRKRRQDQDIPATSSVRTVVLVQRISHQLGGGPSNPDPARRNKRAASAGNLNFGMPPPKPKLPSPDEAWALDSAIFNRSRSSTPSPLVIGKSIPESSSDSSTIAPCTPPNKPSLRPSTEPTIPVSVLLGRARAESPELPPPPVVTKPVISILTDTDTVNRVFSTGSNALESATSTTGSGSFISTAAPISPSTPLVALPLRPASPETPILDLTGSPTPSPEPKIVHKTPPRSKIPPVQAPPSKPPQVSRSIPNTARATTDPNPPKRSPALPLKHTRSEPSQSSKPPTQAAFKPPTQQAFKPPTQSVAKLPPIIHPTQQQQNPRTFPSSQSRLGLGAMGKGYSGVNKPFKVPNKGKGTAPFSVVPLSMRDGGGTPKTPASPSRKKENINAGRGKRGNSPAPAARPSTARPTSGFPSRTASGSSSRTSASSTHTTSPQTTTGKHTQAKRASSSKDDQGSDDAYIGSDESFDIAAVDADMAYWDAWDA